MPDDHEQNHVRTDPMISAITQAFAGRWKEAFERLELKYNKKSWHFVYERHAPEDSCFSLLDRSDGASFLLRIELLSEALNGVEGWSVEDFENWSVEHPESIAVALLEPVRAKGMVDRALGR